MSIGLAGCIGEPGQSEEVQPTIGGGAAATGSHVVVAIIDSGIQPYHEAFAAPVDWKPPAVPDVTVLGEDFKERALGELRTWNELTADKLYHFEGTRVFAISLHRASQFLVFGGENPHVIYDDQGTLGHGTATASIVAQVSPGATMVMIEATDMLEDAVSWAADQSWIDVISVSQGRVAGIPPDPREHPAPLATAIQKAVVSGKLFLMSSGNEPALNVMDEGGLPGVISVGGAEATTHGESIISSKLVDVVGPFTSDRLADKNNLHGYWRAGGTSFSAPAVAGVLAETIHQLRARYGQSGLSASGAVVKTPGKAITSYDIRAAMNATATYWETTEWDPTNYTYTQPFEVLATTAPVLPEVAGAPAGPWVQLGWGFVDERLVPELVAVLSGENPLPEKPAAARDFMQRVTEFKAKWWETWQDG